MRPILTSPRILRTGQPLTLEGIRQVCPSVFATGPHESRSHRYQYVPTEEPVKALMANGWGIYEASQQRARSSKDGYAKHMLRMRKLSDFDVRTQTDTDGVPEVILINAHDGTASYHLKAGFFRFICSNGLIVGNTMAGFTVRHTVGLQTSEEVLRASEKVVTESFPVMVDNISTFKRIVLPREQQYRLAKTAVHLRYGGDSMVVQPDDFLVARRDEDKDPTLWNLLNRIQENVVYGGSETVSFGYGRRSTVRPIERVSSVVHINEGLWDEAMNIAKEMA